MTDNLKKFIEDRRSKYEMNYPPEMKKGVRFSSNDSVVNRLRNMYFEDNKPDRLPKIEEVPRDYIIKNIDRCFDSLCHADWNFSRRDKWI